MTNLPEETPEKKEELTRLKYGLQDLADKRQAETQVDMLARAARGRARPVKKLQIHINTDLTPYCQPSLQFTISP